MVLSPLHAARAQKARKQPSSTPRAQPTRPDPNEAARYIKAAERLYEALEYERALEQLAQARRLPRSLAEDVRIALFEGLILSDMGRRGDARVSFKTGLLLDPDARLPVRAAPKVEREFEEIRDQVRKELGLPPRPPPPPEARAEAPRQTDRPEAPPVEPGVVGRAPEPESRPWLPSSVRMGSTSVPTHSLALLGAGVVAGGVGGFFGLKSRGQLEDARAATYQQELADRRGEAVSSARVANVLFGAAGLLATSAVVTWLTAGGEEVSKTEEVAR
jgi:tetratricopeptide (TPR) repeat protein